MPNFRHRFTRLSHGSAISPSDHKIFIVVHFHRDLYYFLAALSHVKKYIGLSCERFLEVVFVMKQTKQMQSISSSESPFLCPAVKQGNDSDQLQVEAISRGFSAV